MRIGELAERTGASVRALRYYEDQGLLSSGRTTGDQRVYDAGAVDRVLLLRRLYAAGLNSATIAAVMPCVDHPSAGVTRATVALMRSEHERITAQIGDLNAARDQLAYLIDAAAAHGRTQAGDRTTSTRRRRTSDRAATASRR